MRTGINKLTPGLLIAAMLAVLATACAPTTGGTTGGSATGVEAGDLAPPFTMQLTDGSEVSLKNLVDDQQPVLMMYFATW
ncbi:MAG: hypothetical protein F4X64_03775 [Chloroflexi bacterium]|nr:hypothetical protein [Chloroflexota bacterium]